MRSVESGSGASDKSNQLTRPLLSWHVQCRCGHAKSSSANSSRSSQALVSQSAPPGEFSSTTGTVWQRALGEVSSFPDDVCPRRPYDPGVINGKVQAHHPDTRRSPDRWGAVHNRMPS